MQTCVPLQIQILCVPLKLEKWVPLRDILGQRILLQRASWTVLAPHRSKVERTFFGEMGKRIKPRNVCK